MNGISNQKDSKAGDADGKIVILSVPDNKEDILEKILKAVEGLADVVEERRLYSEKIERADLQILLRKKSWTMKMRSCGVLASFGRSWGITRKERLISRQFGV